MHDGPDDVCLIVEGCYPYVRGGVSSWLDWLIRSQPDLSFRIVSIWPQPMPATPGYELPPNVSGLDYLYLHPNLALSGASSSRRHRADRIAGKLVDVVHTGNPADLRELIELTRPLTAADLMRSPLCWDIVERTYRQLMPHAAFLDFFWAWRSLFGGLFAVLKQPLPPARVYHAVSTGYAGLFAARAAVETDAPAVVTEHGIYTNERRIEILLADWITDSVERGLSLDEHRFDLRDLWIRVFESYSRLCYETCSRIVTLYADNQVLQRELGAAPAKLQVIANGIDVARYARVKRPASEVPPTMAFIGRVSPIKDVLSFIRAAALVRREMPDLRALIMGPTDEDPGYYQECVRAVRDNKAEDFVTFTGQVDVLEQLSGIHVVVLTSLSEAQPLVLLEAGAAGVPCVTTDVGACREILEDPMPEVQGCGPGGVVVPVVSPGEIARAVAGILRDPKRRNRMGRDLRRRIDARYRTEVAAQAYRDLYERTAEGPAASAGGA